MSSSTQVKMMEDFFDSLLLDESLSPAAGQYLLKSTIPQATSIAHRDSYLIPDDKMDKLELLLSPLAQQCPLEQIDSIIQGVPDFTIVDNCHKSLIMPESGWRNIDTADKFQVLFFDVADLIFAVPLTELGGIHKLGNVTPLIGQPSWYKGIMTIGEKKISVVDTTQWVKHDHTLKVLDYNYIVLLGKIGWGLACHNLKGIEWLHRSQIKWRTREGKRRWLAGLVKDKMCVLLHVQELILLLTCGADIDGHR